VAYPRILEEFVELVSLPVHSFRERPIADALKAKLGELGLEFAEDGAGGKIGGDAGNIVARWPGDPGLPAVMFSAHMDRVANPGRIVPVVREDEDRITSGGDTILAADDVSGIVAILDGIRRVRESGAPRGDVEIVFSVAEEVGLLGALHLDVSGLRAVAAYVLDCGGRLGTIVRGAPTQYTFRISVRGRSSHAGIAPEDGISAIGVGARAIASLRAGRLSPVTTSNFGVISGGKATNIVCDLLEIKGEARSHDDGELKAYLDEVEAAFGEACGACGAGGAGFEIEYRLEYPSFSVAEDDPAVRLAARAMGKLGIAPALEISGGGQDGNHLNAKGITAVGLATGYANVHTEREEQSISQLVRCGELVSAIIAEAADGGWPGPSR
jgi:tripeptide aminopeptidase